MSDYLRVVPAAGVNVRAVVRGDTNHPILHSTTQSFPRSLAATALPPEPIYSNIISKLQYSGKKRKIMNEEGYRRGP